MSATLAAKTSLGDTKAGSAKPRDTSTEQLAARVIEQCTREAVNCGIVAVNLDLIFQFTHLIPTASADRFFIKTSFRKPFYGTPHLMVDRQVVDGVQTDAAGNTLRVADRR